MESFSSPLTSSGLSGASVLKWRRHVSAFERKLSTLLNMAAQTDEHLPYTLSHIWDISDVSVGEKSPAGSLYIMHTFIILFFHFWIFFPFFVCLFVCLVRTAKVYLLNEIGLLVCHFFVFFSLVLNIRYRFPCQHFFPRHFVICCFLTLNAFNIRRNATQ